MSHFKPALAVAAAAAFLWSAPLVLAQQSPTTDTSTATPSATSPAPASPAPSSGTTMSQPGTMGPSSQSTMPSGNNGQQTGQAAQQPSTPSNPSTMSQGGGAQPGKAMHHRTRLSREMRPHRVGNGNTPGYDRLNGKTNSDTSRLNQQELQQVGKSG